MTTSARIGTANESDAARRDVRHAVGLGTVAGLLTGLIGLIPVLIYQASRGVGIVLEMQIAASGVIGMAAYAGTGGFLLGIVMHFFVSVVPAIAYALVAWRLPWINRWAWLGGPLLGVIVLLFMGLVVLPLSAFDMPASISPMPPLAALLVHVFAFGLPIALIIRHGYRTGQRA